MTTTVTTIRGKNANCLQGLDIDEEKLGSAMEQIGEKLIAARLRVKDLFMQIDDDESGKISREEFIKALRELGLDAPRLVIGKIFDKVDADSDGVLSFPELSRATKPARSVPFAKKKEKVFSGSMSMLRQRLQMRQRSMNWLDKARAKVRTRKFATQRDLLMSSGTGTRGSNAWPRLSADPTDPACSRPPQYTHKLPAHTLTLHTLTLHASASMHAPQASSSAMWTPPTSSRACARAISSTPSSTQRKPSTRAQSSAATTLLASS